MIIFGASGDLTKRKLMPALYSLYRDKRLTGSFTVLGIGRTVYSDEDYRSYILGELQQFVKAEEQNLELMSSFVSHLYYLPMDPAKVEGYSQLRERLVELTPGSCSQRDYLEAGFSYLRSCLCCSAQRLLQVILLHVILLQVIAFIRLLSAGCFPGCHSVVARPAGPGAVLLA